MNQVEDQEKRLQQMVDESRRIVFFGGAGVSTETGKLVLTKSREKIT